MRVASVFLAIGGLFLAGCGREEKAEAVRLSSILTEKQADYAKADATEKELVANATAWCGLITSSGAGKAAELGQNATVATELAKSISAISTILGQVRQAVADQPLKTEYPQTVRTDLMSELSRRQRALQEMRSLLQKSAAQFLDYRTSKTYAGDTYPGEIQQLNALMQAYKPPQDALATALTALKTKYGLTGNEK